MPNAIFFYFLFNNFYKKNFDTDKSEKAKQKALDDSNNNNLSDNNENSKNKYLNKKQS